VDLRALTQAGSFVLLLGMATTVSACGGHQLVTTSPAESGPAESGADAATRAAATVAKAATATPTPIATPLPMTHRTKFLGAFFRAAGAPPFGVFDPSSGTLPVPYPVSGIPKTGPNGYCDKIAANGASITGSYVVDQAKLADIVNLGVGWTRMGANQQTDDNSHIWWPGDFTFTDLDSAQCATLVAHGIQPIINLSTGPVEYNSNPGHFSPTLVANYKTAQDYAAWCGAAAAHERATFNVVKFSIPGNEVNTDPTDFPGGNAQIAAYMEACYAAIKAASPQATVYGFELNMDGNVDAPGFVSTMYALGCKQGTCYDAISMHLSLRYPTPASNVPCYPAKGGDYSLLCINAIQAAANSPHLHVLIGESVYPVPAGVPNEQTKAAAVVAEFSALSPHSSVDGVSYANVDECALYPPSSFWAGGCLVSESGVDLPAYTALQTIAQQYFQ
jgi:hypothetical protein